MGDMEELTKTQLILLALLVSFVTSIATGIATVALMDQAPADVTRVINRVVERTIEKVTPTEQGASVVTQEKTVIVKEEDALTSAIDSISKSLVRLYQGDGTSRVFLGMGAVLGPDKYVVTDADIVTLGARYEGVLPDGTSIVFEAIGNNKAKGIGVLSVITETGNETSALVGLKATQVTTKLGQTVFTVSGELTKIGTGIVSGLPKQSEMGSGDIEVTINTSGFVTGAPLGNLFGEVVGIARSTNTQLFIPISEALTVVKAVKEEVVRTTTDLDTGL
jgi:S1-C subfamily serine protease